MTLLGRVNCMVAGKLIILGANPNLHHKKMVEPIGLKELTIQSIKNKT